MEAFLIRNLKRVQDDFNSRDGSIKVMFDGAIIIGLAYSFYITYLYVFDRSKYHIWKEVI